MADRRTPPKLQNWFIKLVFFQSWLVVILFASSPKLYPGLLRSSQCNKTDIMLPFILKYLKINQSGLGD